MENASKALIIAGAILLAILIIALGVMVYNNAKETVGSANLSETEISAFNSKWEAYVSENATASEVKTMISAMIANNASEETNGSERYVGVNGVTVSSGTHTVNNGTDPASVPSVSANVTYNITAIYNTNTGLIDGMNVTNN